MSWIKSLLRDWLRFFEDDNFQQDLVFLAIVFLGRILHIYNVEIFRDLVIVIIGGDAIKKLGVKK